MALTRRGLVSIAIFGLLLPASLPTGAGDPVCSPEAADLPVQCMGAGGADDPSWDYYAGPERGLATITWTTSGEKTVAAEVTFCGIVVLGADDAFCATSSDESSGTGTQTASVEIVGLAFCGFVEVSVSATGMNSRGHKWNPSEVPEPIICDNE